jgi:DNA-binding MarR family transcriptional regulator
LTDFVKDTPPHVALLLGLAFERIRQTFDDPRWQGLRQSHLRIVESIAPGGSRAGDLARRLRMTKQGAGQLVAGLLERGLVAQVPDRADGRARLLVLTEAGTELRRAVDEQLARLESDWAAEVGRDDYATFRTVLERIATVPARRG